MTIRTIRKTIVFRRPFYLSRPFYLKGVDRLLPTDEDYDRLNALARDAWRLI